MADKEMIDKSDVLRSLCAACDNTGSFACISCVIPRIIRDMPAIESVKCWIPCSDSLPEYGLDVLVYIKSWDEHIQVAHIQYDGIMWEMSDGEYYFSQSDVTHWMPLPEPPEK